MTHKTIMFILVVIFLLGATMQAAQEPRASSPDGWHGLTVDVSTPDDAIRLLGKPSGDKVNQSLHILMVDKWLTASKVNQKIFRRLTFTKPAGLAEVRLSFLDDKLVTIELDPKTGDVPDWVDPDDLATLFNARFIVQEWHFGKKLPPLADFEAKINDDSPKKFAEIYDMIATSERTFVFARTDNITARTMGLFTRGCSFCAKEENRKRKARDAGGTFPGQVSFIEIVSRRLGNQEEK